MFKTSNRFGNQASAILGAVVMTAACFAVAVSPARAASQPQPQPVAAERPAPAAG